MNAKKVMYLRRKRTEGYLLGIFAAVLVGGAGSYLSPWVAALGVPLGMLAAWLVLTYDEKVRAEERRAQGVSRPLPQAHARIKRQIDRGIFHLLTDDPQDRLRVLGKGNSR